MLTIVKPLSELCTFDTRWPAIVLVRATISVWFVCDYFQGSLVQYPVAGVCAWFVDSCKSSINRFRAQC